MNRERIFSVLIIIAFVFSNGACGQREASVSKSAELTAALNEPNALVVDVRSANEFSQGHVPGSVNVPVGNLSATIEQVVGDKTTPVILHCESGGRSARAFAAMKKLGYGRVVDGQTPEAVAKAKGVSLTGAAR